ncbi:hypothetical protein FDI63_gp083 [Mycobacterium phage ChrisnMich]|uniref:Uncharacterized protein n=1 Tax=Mycobacterium phage ChrisnMich TaxID=1034130 RepID=G1BLE0_9CAUD|nr:hypothetical protein FDI63_gp083 [Mycobacterium phage ChrisnMich]AEJ94618.1 hypothetical protein CHRISNMICH_83 [Mycobacterium phage ChrisnMich]
MRDWLFWWLDTLLGWQFSWRDAALGVALGFVLRVWLLHRRAGQQAATLATAPAAIDPATEVVPGTMLVAMVAALDARPWWAPWRPCHRDHVTLAEVTLDRPLAGNVRIGVSPWALVLHDDVGTLLTVGRDQMPDAAPWELTAVVRTR